jgi:hypothetical protein
VEHGESPFFSLSSSSRLGQRHSGKHAPVALYIAGSSRADRTSERPRSPLTLACAHPPGRVGGWVLGKGEKPLSSVDADRVEGWTARSSCQTTRGRRLSVDARQSLGRLAAAVPTEPLTCRAGIEAQLSALADCQGGCGSAMDWAHLAATARGGVRAERGCRSDVCAPGHCAAGDAGTNQKAAPWGRPGRPSNAEHA